MKKLVVTVGLIAVFMVGSIPAVLARDIDEGAGYTDTDLSIALARSANLRLRFINEELYPDNIAAVDDWLCDGMTPCFELSPRRPA